MVASPYSLSAVGRPRRMPRGDMQRDLVERARRGDHDAFAELAGAAISRLDAAAWLILRDPDRAADAVQNALVRAWRDLPTLRDVRTASMPGCIDCSSVPASMRRAAFEAPPRRCRTHPAGPPAVAGLESAVADRDQLERGFLRLEPEMRAVIVLHHYLDLSMPDVAATLGIPVGTAKSRLHRALGLMRAALDADTRVNPTISEGRPA